MLATLPVKGRAPKTGYSRDQFGSGWVSVNGCDTRDTILRRDLDPVAVSGAKTCRVVAGTLHDPYTGVTIKLSAARLTTADIDHVVALSDGWQKGAQTWSETRRVQFANDPLNLLTTTQSINSAKGDGDAATWLPPSRGFRCQYVARQVSVKAKFNAWVTGAEKQAMARVLSTCPKQETISAAQARHRNDPRATVVQPQPKPRPKPGRPSTDPRYPTCKAANEAGLGPYYRGQDPEYEWYRDRDHDGIVCER